MNYSDPIHTNAGILTQLQETLAAAEEKAHADDASTATLSMKDIAGIRAALRDTTRLLTDPIEVIISVSGGLVEDTFGVDGEIRPISIYLRDFDNTPDSEECQDEFAQFTTRQDGEKAFASLSLENPQPLSSQDPIWVETRAEAERLLG